MERIEELRSFVKSELEVIGNEEIIITMNNGSSYKGLIKNIDIIGIKSNKIRLGDLGSFKVSSIKKIYVNGAIIDFSNFGKKIKEKSSLEMCNLFLGV